MTVAFWCILAASLLPILCAGLAKGGSPDFDNAQPRVWLAAQTGWRRRANWAQQNSLEAIAPFAAAVIVARLAGAPQSMADAVAVAFVLIRLGYIAAYIFDRPRLRSALFNLGLGCVIALFAVAA
jgi:uncharacterized MAPEG superfamily protein